MKTLNLAAFTALSMLCMAAPVAVHAQEEPSGQYYGEVQNGNPNAEQGYQAGDAYNAGYETNAEIDLEEAQITEGASFDGSSESDTVVVDPGSGTWAEPNSE